MKLSLPISLFALSVFACKKSADAPPAQGSNAIVNEAANSGSAVATGSGSGSAQAAAPDNWGSVDPKAKTPPKVKEDPKVIAERALKRIPMIKAGLATLRGQPFKIDVPAEYQTNADFRAFMKKQIDKEMGTEKTTAIMESWVHLGLLKEKTDLVQVMIDAMASQAAAYYDPDQKKFFLVMTPDNDVFLDTISAHELTHAHQDQYFALDKFLKSPDGKMLTDDVQNARRFLVEGEATFAMFAYMASGDSKQLQPKMLSSLNAQLAMTANLSSEQLREQMKAQSAMMGVGGEMNDAAAAMDKIPPILLVPMMDSYMKGAIPVAKAFEKGGWSEVAKLYEKPPQSTEQMLHPDGKLYPTRDLPQRIEIKTPAGTTLIESNIIGELGWRVYLEQWGVTTANESAAGWDGDRFSVVKTKTGDLVALLATTWDSEADAIDYEASYKASLVKRFGGDGSKRNDKAIISVVRSGSSVYIVDGADAVESKTLMAQLVKGKFAEEK